MVEILNFIYLSFSVIGENLSKLRFLHLGETFASLLSRCHFLLWAAAKDAVSLHPEGKAYSL